MLTGCIFVYHRYCVVLLKSNLGFIFLFCVEFEQKKILTWLVLTLLCHHSVQIFLFLFLLFLLHCMVYRLVLFWFMVLYFLSMFFSLFYFFIFKLYSYICCWIAGWRSCVRPQIYPSTCTLHMAPVRGVILLTTPFPIPKGDLFLMACFVCPWNRHVILLSSPVGLANRRYIRDIPRHWAPEPKHMVHPEEIVQMVVRGRSNRHYVGYCVERDMLEDVSWEKQQNGRLGIRNLVGTINSKSISQNVFPSH